MTEENMQEAIVLAREGRKAEARWLLEGVLNTDRTNETAWLWYADCVETFEERLAALESCLRANPRALRVRAGLSLLYKASGQETSRASALADLHDELLSNHSLAIGFGENTNEPMVAVTGGRLAVAALQRETLFAAEDGTLLFDPFNEPADQLFAEVWGVTDGSAPKSDGVFTVAPDALSQQEFSEVEAREGRFLAAHPDLHPLHAQRNGRVKSPQRVEEDWDELSKTGSPRVAASHDVPTRPLAHAEQDSQPKRKSSSYDMPTKPQSTAPTRRLISPFAVVMLVLVMAVLLGAVLAANL